VCENKLINIVKNKIPSDVIYNIFSASARDKVYETLVFTPIIKQSGGNNKIIHFKLSVQENNSKSLSTVGNISSKSIKNLEVVSSVLATGEWFKFRIDTMGAYKIA